jgi:hypothetical protein
MSRTRSAVSPSPVKPAVAMGLGAPALLVGVVVTPPPCGLRLMVVPVRPPGVPGMMSS